MPAVKERTFLHRKGDALQMVMYVILFLILAALFIGVLWYRLPRYAP